LDGLCANAPVPKFRDPGSFGKRLFFSSPSHEVPVHFNEGLIVWVLQEKPDMRFLHFNKILRKMNAYFQAISKARGHVIGGRRPLGQSGAFPVNTRLPEGYF
jgi:hypothetical protein